MELEKKIYQENLFFRLARKTTLFVINERVYYCGGEDSENFFLGNKGKFGVREGPSLMTLENLSNKRLGKEYRRYQESFISLEIKLSRC